MTCAPAARVHCCSCCWRCCAGPPHARVVRAAPTHCTPRVRVRATRLAHLSVDVLLKADQPAGSFWISVGSQYRKGAPRCARWCGAAPWPGCRGSNQPLASVRHWPEAAGALHTSVATRNTHPLRPRPAHAHAHTHTPPAAMLSCATRAPGAAQTPTPSCRCARVWGGRSSGRGSALARDREPVSTACSTLTCTSVCCAVSLPRGVWRVCSPALPLPGSGTRGRPWPSQHQRCCSTCPAAAARQQATRQRQRTWRLPCAAAGRGGCPSETLTGASSCRCAAVWCVVCAVGTQ